MTDACRNLYLTPFFPHSRFECFEMCMMGASRWSTRTHSYVYIKLIIIYSPSVIFVSYFRVLKYYFYQVKKTCLNLITFIFKRGVVSSSGILAPMEGWGVTTTSLQFILFEKLVSRQMVVNYQGENTTKCYFM